MSTQITLTIPDETYKRAKHLAQLTGKNIEEVLADTLDISLNNVSESTALGQAIVDLSDAEVLALADSQMASSEQQRLTTLLEKQQAAQISAEDSAELLKLMQVYQDGLLRKAQALNEAVRRGLRKPLEP